MKKLIAILFIIFLSCNETKTSSLQKKDNAKDTIKGNLVSMPEFEEIGRLYLPEAMRQDEIQNENNKNNYQYTLKNSDLLDVDLKNIKRHADKIANLYHQYLVRTNKPFDYNRIIVKIIHRNEKVDLFEYSEKDMRQLFKD